MEKSKKPNNRSIRVCGMKTPNKLKQTNKKRDLIKNNDPKSEFIC